MPFSNTVETPIEPECRVDRDCPAKMACIEDRCQNPCLTSNPCGRNQVCTVEDSYDGRRTVGCTCPPDQVSAGDNLCKTGSTFTRPNSNINSPPFQYSSVEALTECSLHDECRDDEVCHQGSCQEACLFLVCGQNAECLAQGHRADCHCLPGYDGNPLSSCNKRECLSIPPKSQ